MIISQTPASQIAALSYATVATIQAFQNVTTIGGTPNGLPAGAVAMPIGEGFQFGVPFHVVIAGVVNSVTTGRTITVGMTAFPGPSAPAASPTLTTTLNAGASQTLTAGAQYGFFVDYELFIDGNSNKLSGLLNANFAIASGNLAQAQAVTVTGFTLPAVATPYSWTSPLTGGAGTPNAPFAYLVPQVTASGTDVSSTVTLTSFYVSQG